MQSTQVEQAELNLTDTNENDSNVELFETSMVLSTWIKTPTLITFVTQMHHTLLTLLSWLKLASLLWIFLCTFRYRTLVNIFVQTSQLYFLSALWVNLCCRRVYLLWNRISQPGHLQSYSPSPSCQRVWALSWDAILYDFPQPGLLQVLAPHGRSCCSKTNVCALERNTITCRYTMLINLRFIVHINVVYISSSVSQTHNYM
jgi:hypothetical protein